MYDNNIIGNVQRKCIMGDMWEENVRCFTEDSGNTQILLDQVATTTSCVRWSTYSCCFRLKI